MERAIILTLNNTLITTLSNREHSTHLEDWKFIKETVLALEYYLVNNYSRICIVCNQSAIYNKLITEKSFILKMNNVVERLERKINKELGIKGLYNNLKIKKNFISYSYTIDKESYYYLPKPGLLFSLALDFELDLYNSIFIGNSAEDESSAILAGVKTYINVLNLNQKI